MITATNIKPNDHYCLINEVEELAPLTIVTCACGFEGIYADGPAAEAAAFAHDNVVTLHSGNQR